MEVAEAFSLISRAIDTGGGRSGGYLVVGDIKSNCANLVSLVLKKLYPAAPNPREHPDVAWLEPEGRSRTIKVDSMRERIIAPMETSSYSGGWKTGVVVGADRMQQTAANAFLKSLEEPTPRTLFLLLTDRPDSLLPTIVSRCQRIDLPLPSGALTGEPAEIVRRIMSAKGLGQVYPRLLAAKNLAALLAELKDGAEDEDVPIVRKAFFQTVMSVAREWMVGGLVPRHLAFRNIEAVEEAFARSEKYIPDDAVLSFMLDKMAFPQ